MSRTLHIVIAATALIATVLIGDAWRLARKNAAQLATTIATQNTLIEQASLREAQRNKDLAAALASIDAAKKHVQTPQQAIDAIPSVLPPLPLPIKIQIPNLAQSPAPDDQAPATISIPQPDLKPLYDTLQDDRACALERDATKKDLADEQARAAALTKERDAAIKAAHGGTFWSHLKQAAKWFAIGAATTAIATRASRHQAP